MQFVLSTVKQKTEFDKADVNILWSNLPTFIEQSCA